MLGPCQPVGREGIQFLFEEGGKCHLQRGKWKLNLFFWAQGGGGERNELS